MSALQLEAGPNAVPSRRSVLPRFTLVGPHDAPVVAILGGISATRNVVDSAEGSGWWGTVAGNGLAIDTTRHRVLGIDFMDGGVGPRGRPRRVVTTHDQALWLARILRSAGIPRLHAIVGSSYGGMVALAFAERFASLAERAVIISAAHESDPMTTALRTLQRRVVELGIETGTSRDAMSIARGIAMTTYRSRDEFAARFRPGASIVEGRLDCDVDAYLRNRGDAFADTMRPERFLALSLSADLHRVRPESIAVPTTVVAAEGDLVVPFAQTEQLTRRLGGARHLVELPTAVGHDAFLVETGAISRILHNAIT